MLKRALVNRSRLSCKHFGGNDESRCSRDQQRRPTCAASHEEYVAQAMCLVGLHTSFEAIANGERITLNTPATGDIEHPTTKPRHPRSSREYEPNHQGLTPTSSFAKHGLHNSSASPSIRAIKCRDTKHLGNFWGSNPDASTFSSHQDSCRNLRLTVVATRPRPSPHAGTNGSPAEPDLRARYPL